MAKLIITEVYEGTNEQIKALEDKARVAANSSNGKSHCGEKLVEVAMLTNYNVEETKLQKQLRKELEQLRPSLSASLIAKAESLIKRAAEFNSVTELITSVTNEELGEEEEEEEQESYFDEDELDSEAYDEDDEDECDCDCDCDCEEEEDEEDDSFEQFLIRIILG